VRPLVMWDHTVLPVTRQRWFSRLYPGMLLVNIQCQSFIDPGRMKGWVG